MDCQRRPGRELRIEGIGEEFLDPGVKVKLNIEGE